LHEVFIFTIYYSPTRRLDLGVQSVYSYGAAYIEIFVRQTREYSVDKYTSFASATVAQYRTYKKCTAKITDSS